MKTARALAALLCTAAASLASAEWTPPPNPDPRAIHNEARKDRIEQRYDDALAKHLWLHRDGVKAQPAWAAARLSFALGDWAHLAAKHPPAMTALTTARDNAEVEVRAGRDALASFNDFAAINRELDEPGRTVALFSWVEARDPALAKQLYSAAEHALLTSGDYKTAFKYMDPNVAMEQVVRTHMRMVRTLPKDAAAQAKVLHEHFARESGRIVALLAANGRTAHAKVIAEKALEVDGSSEVREVIAAALKGTFPKDSLTRDERQDLRLQMP
ncbi:MAG TPA: hypothetical protein VM122_07320 [Usitatibacter sp.]|nr:hypothetical protein [Usitatibacter sp.]